MLRQQQGGGGGHGHARNGTVVIGLDVALDGARQFFGEEGFPLLRALEVLRVRLGYPVGVVGESTGLRDDDVDVLGVVEIDGIGKLQPVHVLLRAACAIEQVDGRAVLVRRANDSQRNLAAVHGRGGGLQLIDARIVLVLLVPSLLLQLRGDLQRGQGGLGSVACYLLRGELCGPRQRGGC